MISAAREDDRQVAAVPADRPTVPAAPTTLSVPAATLVPTARRAPEHVPFADQMRAPAALLDPVLLDTAHPSAFRVAGVVDAPHSGPHLDRLVADLESSATAAAWVVRLVLLGAVGLVLLVAVL